MKELVESETFTDFEHSVDVVIGGPPCQAISVAGYRSRRAKDDDYSVLEDNRTKLYQEYIAAIQSLEPEVILMENVEGLISTVGDSDIRISDLVLDSLNDIGYNAEYRLINCSEYGLPQERNRVFILGIKNETDTSSSVVSSLLNTIFENSSEEEYTLRQALAGLPHIERGEGGRVTVGKTSGPRGEYVNKNNINNNSRLVFNHQAREHPKNRDRKLFDEALEPGQTSWDVIQNPEYEHLVEYDLGTEDNPRFKDKYRMLDWESKSPTVVAHLEKDANSFILPDYHRYYTHTQTETNDSRNRGITPREAARLQSFPDDFIFLGAFTNWFVQIGNAVPPIIAEQIGDGIHHVLSEHISKGETRAKITTASVDSDD
jgi:DNA (cytosine-5)-methyltransferase 1